MTWLPVVFSGVCSLQTLHCTTYTRDHWDGGNGSSTLDILEIGTLWHNITVSSDWVKHYCYDKICYNSHTIDFTHERARISEANVTPSSVCRLCRVVNVTYLFFRWPQIRSLVWIGSAIDQWWVCQTLSFVIAQNNQIRNHFHVRRQCLSSRITCSYVYSSERQRLLVRYS